MNESFLELFLSHSGVKNVGYLVTKIIYFYEEKNSLLPT